MAADEAGDEAKAGAAAPDGRPDVGGVAVEELSFEIEAEVLERWVAREAQAWDAFLAAQEGFLGKQVWIGPEGPRRTVRVVVWWASRAQWKAVDSAAVAAVDERMGALLRPAECREFQLLRRA